MKKNYLLIIMLTLLFCLDNMPASVIRAKDVAPQNTDHISIIPNENAGKFEKPKAYTYPQFYRGIYLNVASAKDLDKLTKFVQMSKKSYINTMVLDVQSSKYRKCIVPPQNVQYIIENGIHPVARIVVFPDGLKDYPVSKEYIDDKIDIAISACDAGFREIQFDYIRFNDSKRLKYLKVGERYAFIEGFLANMRKHLEKYNVRIAADIFGRIPLNKTDIIGQRMEGLDSVVDMICPMAYPSHYTWDKRLQKDPYYTVLITSKKAAERTQKAHIVPYIQAFKMRLFDMPYDKYISEQLRAIHDSGVKGFLLWNASQTYDVPLEVTKKFYTDRGKM